MIVSSDPQPASPLPDHPQQAGGEGVCLVLVEAAQGSVDEQHGQARTADQARYSAPGRCAGQGADRGCSADPLQIHRDREGDPKQSQRDLVKNMEGYIRTDNATVISAEQLTTKDTNRRTPRHGT
jgi:hypothetical protein